jgi:hypothetical protein
VRLSATLLVLLVLLSPGSCGAMGQLVRGGASWRGGPRGVSSSLLRWLCGHSCVKLWEGVAAAAQPCDLCWTWRVLRGCWREAGRACGPGGACGERSHPGARCCRVSVLRRAGLAAGQLYRSGLCAARRRAVSWRRALAPSRGWLGLVSET